MRVQVMQVEDDIKKKFEALEKRVTELEDKNRKLKRVNDIVYGLPALTAGTINTGDATTDAILVSLVNRVEKLIQNINNQ